MSKLNKLVTNYPVSLSEEEIENLSATLAPVVAACGGGGGGTGGKIYTGIGFVSVNNSTNQIGLTEAANTKLNQDIPSAVSSFPDSVQYAKKTYVDNTYQTKEDMTAYLTTANANSDYAKKTLVETVSGNIVAKIPTKTSQLSNDKPFLIHQDMVNYGPGWMDLNDGLSTKQDELIFGYDENNAISSIDGHEIAGTGGTTGDYYSASNPSGFITSSVSELDNFYSKTDTSSKTELQTKFDSLLDYNVTAAAGIEVTTATDVGIKTFGISMTAQPVVTDTRLSGYNGIAAEPDGNVSGLWDVGLTQDMLNTINGKLDSTVAAQTYQPKGDYVSSTDITDMATKTWVEQKNYLTQVPSEYVTDTELQTTLSDYATNTLVQNTSANITALIPSTAGLASENDLQIVSAGVDYVSAHAITAHQSLTNYYTKSETSGATELSTEFGKYALKSEIPTVPTKVSDLTDSANYYKTTETSSKNELSTEFAKYLTTAQYNTDSATFALKSDLNDLVSSASVTTNDNYVMTNTGWKVLTLPGGGMTQVYHDTTLTGDGNDANSKLGVVWSALSGNTINSALSAGSATNAVSADKAVSASASKRLQDSTSGPVIQVGDVTALQNWASSNSSTWDSVTAKLTTAQYALDSATFVTSSNSTITGTKQYALTTAGWSDIGLSAYLPLSGGTVSGLTTISGSDFDNTLEVKRAGQANNFAHIGLNNSRGLSFKAFDTNASTNVQFDLFPNNSNSALIQVQHNGSTVGNLIPAVTATTTAGLTNDGILHIILES